MGLSQTPAPTETQAQSVPVDHRPQGAEGIAQPVSRFGVGDSADGKGCHSHGAFHVVLGQPLNLRSGPP
jgi:hypothetical protein